MPARTRFVLADDHAAMRMAVRARLDRVEWLQCVGEAEDGEAALALLVTLRPELAILDIRMPKLDGMQVAAEAGRRSLPTRIVLHSAFSSDSIREAATARGVVACVSKEGPPGALLAALELARDLSGPTV